MPLPSSRISLNKNENAAIRSGLDRILNEFASVRTTSRRVPDLLDTSLKDKLQPRSFTPEHYDLILCLRNGLAAVAHHNRSKHRVNVIECAILAFALRVARRFNKAQASTKLDKKLEIHRKRAKRRAIAAAGHAAYKGAAELWVRTSRWIRFNLLPLPTKRGYRYHKPRKFYGQQFRTMVVYAQAVIAERCTEALAVGELERLVKLVIREILRRRHPDVTVRELVADEQRAKGFLFEVMKKKRDLALKFEFMSPDQQ